MIGVRVEIKDALNDETIRIQYFLIHLATVIIKLLYKTHTIFFTKMESITGKSNLHKLVELGKDFISLFYPHYCLGCTNSLVKGEDILCTYCIHQLPKTNYQITEENPVKNRFSGRLNVKYAAAYLKFRKTGIVQKLLHQLKYRHHPEVGIKLGQLMGFEQVKAVASDINLIVPVPLHASRERQRGYNQSAKLAEGISMATGIAWANGISVRTARTKTQTRMNRAERWENVKSVFNVKDRNALEGKHILLVDDVMTTGATLEACGQHLLANGCATLSILCIAEA